MTIDETDSRYRCLCGACRARIGAIWVAGFEGLVALTFLIFGLICQNHVSDEGKRYYSVAAPSFYALTVLTLMFVVVLALGLAFKNGCLLIIHMIKCCIFVALLTVTIILGILVAVTAGTGAFAIGTVVAGREDHPHKEARDTFMTLTVISAIVVAIHILFAILQIWFIFIVLSAYRAVRDLNRSGGAVLTQQQMSIVTQAPPQLGAPNYQTQTTTYYPSGGTQPTAPPAPYSPMVSGYPAAPMAPPPYSEKEY